MLTGCIPISVYCATFNESLDAVNKRIQRGVWIQGKQYHVVEGVKERWIDLDGITQWVRENSK